MAEKLREKEFQLAFATSLSRSSNTLEIVLKHHPECKKVIVDDRLIERSDEHLKKKHPKTVINNFGKTQFDLWHRFYDVAPPGSESMKMVEKRVLPFTKDLLTLLKGGPPIPCLVPPLPLPKPLRPLISFSFSV